MDYSEEQEEMTSPAPDESQSHDDSSSNQSEEAEIRDYVSEFRKEVDKKFLASTVNQTYRFPRKRIQTEEREREDGLNENSLANVIFYDLESQNVKRELCRTSDVRKRSDTTFLVDVIKKLGKLDHRYLDSQLRSCRSPFFKVLQTSVQRKLQREKGSHESVKSCSAKTKSIVMTKKGQPVRPVTKNSENLTIQRNFLSSGYHLGGLQKYTTPSVPPKASPKLPLGLVPALSQSRTYNSSVSPRSNHSQHSLATKPKKNSESLKNLAKLRKNFSGNHCTKQAINSSTWNAQRIGQIGSILEQPPLLPQHRKHIVHSNINISSHSSSKPRIKVKETMPLSTKQQKNPLTKNQISFAKEQIQSLIQKNITKRATPDAEADGFNPEKSFSRSTKRRQDGSSVGSNINIGTTVMIKNLLKKNLNKNPL